MANALDGQEQRGGGFVGTVAKKAFLSLAATAASAASAYLVRKAAQLWEEKVLPKLEEKGGGRAAARELLETTADKVGDPATEKLKGLAEKVGVEGSGAETGSSSAPDEKRDKERRRREQRRQQRRRSLEQTGSS